MADQTGSSTRKSSLIPSGIRDVLKHQRAGTASVYIDQFVAEFPEVVMSLVQDPVFGNWGRDRKLEKEITESIAALARVKRLLIKRGADVEGDGAGVHFVEMCSGKGFCSLLLSTLWPAARITMCDVNATMDISHTTKLPNVSFHPCDIFSDDMAALIEAAATDGKTCILIGVHLCGALSARAIQLWKTSRAAGLVLSPCCLPSRRRTDAFGYNVLLLARKTGVDPYTIWCLELYGLLGNTAGHSRDVSIDEDILSKKNAFIAACKSVEN